MRFHLYLIFFIQVRQSTGMEIMLGEFFSASFIMKILYKLENRSLQLQKRLDNSMIFKKNLKDYPK
jgi:hypothetical protein